MPNDDEILYRPVLDENTHLGDSRRTEGCKASTVYSDDDGSTVDIAEWEPVYPSDEDERDGSLDELSVAIGVLIGVAATALAAFGVSKAKPHVQRLINEHVAPRASSIAQTIKRKIGLQASNEVESPSIELQESNKQMQLETAKENEFNLKLSESQAEMLLMSAFQDYLIYATKIRIIGNAQIVPEDQNNASRLEEAKKFLLSSNGLDKINAYLEANPQWFTGENVELFLDLYGREPIANGVYLPISDSEFEQTTFLPSSDIKLMEKAHEYCTANEKALKDSDSCGCFYCLTIYRPSEIKEWIEDKNGNTAICPHCGIDAVLPSNDEHPLNKVFLQKMHQFWFEA